MYIPKSLSALVKSVSTDKTRPHMGRVHVERDAEGKPYAAATNGRHAVVVSWEEPEEGWPDGIAHTEPLEEFSTDIAPEDIEACVRMIPKKSDKAEFTWGLLEERESEFVSLKATDGKRVHTVETLHADSDSRFPNWRHVLPEYHILDQRNPKSMEYVGQYFVEKKGAPKEQYAATALVDAKQLRDVVEEIEKLTGSTRKDATIRLTVPLYCGRAVLIEQVNATEGRAALGIVMPYREEGKTRQHRDALSAVRSPRQAEAERAEAQEKREALHLVYGRIEENREAFREARLSLREGERIVAHCDYCGDPVVWEIQHGDDDIEAVQRLDAHLADFEQEYLIRAGMSAALYDRFRTFENPKLVGVNT